MPIAWWRRMNSEISLSAFSVVILLLLLPLNGNSETPVWIDSDPACDERRTHDVDDCWALVRALQADELSVRGISTVFGNSSESVSFHVMTDLLKQAPNSVELPLVHRGASLPFVKGIESSHIAVEALSAALRVEPLTIIALGPLTNIAALVTEYPELSHRIVRLVVVAGQRPEQGSRFHPGSSQLFHVHDFNFRKDVSAFQILLDSDLPITLLPYEAASKVRINERDLMEMKSAGSQTELLAKLAEPWLDYWKSMFGSDSFYPFDSLAVGYVIDSQWFSCKFLPARIDRKQSLFLPSRDRLLVSESFVGGRELNYCYDVDPRFKNDLLLSLQR